MDSTKDIGRDIHKEAISIAVMNSAGLLIMESILRTVARRMGPGGRGSHESGSFSRFILASSSLDLAAKLTFGLPHFSEGPPDL